MNDVRELACAEIEARDLMSGYLGGRLSEEDAEAFEKHYFGCEKCWAELKAGTEIRAALAGQSGADATKRRRVWTDWRLLAAAAAVVLAIGGGLLLRRESSGIDALARAAGTRRTSEGRLTGAFEYAPVAPIFRGATSQPEAPLRLRRTALEAYEKVEERPSPASIHAAGVGHLLLDEWDEAVATLEKASQEAPKDAAIWSDLAAAYLTRAARRGRAADLPPAHEAARKAVDLDPRSAPAQFNLALALDNIGLKDAAREAWKKYLEMDPRSGWAEEARQREKVLEAPPQSEQWRNERGNLDAAAEAGRGEEVLAIVGRFPQQARQYVEDELLSEWADGSEAALVRARSIADALKNLHGEGLAADAVAAIAAAAGSPDDVTRLREGHKAFGAARKAYKAADIATATTGFGAAEGHFAGTASPFLHLARLGRASCMLYGSRDQEASSLVAALVAESQTKPNDRALAGQALWVQGLVEGGVGHPYESLHDYQLALTIFERLDESENVAGIHDLLEDRYEALGEPEEAWNQRVAALRRYDSGSAPARLTNCLGTIVRTSLRDGYHRTALVADEAEVRASERSGVPLFRSYSRMWRAQAEGKLERADDARNDLAAASSLSSQITDSGTRERAGAAIELASIRLDSEVDAERALQHATRALEFGVRVGEREQLPELYLVRGRLFAGRGDDVRAEQDFAAGIEGLEAAAATVADEDLQISFRETARQLFDEAIAIAARTDSSASFQLAERGRARVLMQAVSRSSNGAFAGLMTPAAISSAIPEDAALVAYWILDDRTLIWSVRRGGVKLVSVPIAKDRLRHLVATATAHVAEAKADPKPELRQLYDTLIAPIRDDIRGASTLIVVPDRWLHHLPFSALLEDRSGKYLIQSVSVVVSPSASLAVVARHRSSARPPNESVLLVANPTFSRVTFPHLAALAAAEEECSEIARIFPKTRVLAGVQATRRNLLELAPAFSILHFAGHALTPSGKAEGAALLLAETAGDRGILYASDISRWNLPRTRLVVLAACNSAGGPLKESEGPLSLVRALFEAGVPSVVASLWLVPDNDDTRLMREFYRNLSRGVESAAALQAAQIAILDDKVEARSYSWSSLEMFGSGL